MKLKTILRIFILGLFFLGMSSCAKQTDKQKIVQEQDFVSLFVQGELQLTNEELSSTETMFFCVDTTMFRYFDINGNGSIDTLTTRVFVKSDTIFIHYSWLQNQKIIWSDLITDSALTGLTDSIEREKWINFVISGCNPEKEKISDYEHLFDFAFNFAIDDLKKAGLNISEEEYKSYLLDYKGNLFYYGHPIVSEGLFIWYEPAKMVVLFYQP